MCIAMGADAALNSQPAASRPRYFIGAFKNLK